MVKNTATDMHNHTTLTNFHVITVKYIAPGPVLGSRVKIISERFKQSITLGYDDEFANSLDQAENWLIEHGYNVIGHGEGKGHTYVICGHVNGSFQPLK